MHVIKKYWLMITAFSSIEEVIQENNALFKNTIEGKKIMKVKSETFFN